MKGLIIIVFYFKLNLGTLLIFYEQATMNFYTLLKENVQQSEGIVWNEILLNHIHFNMFLTFLNPLTPGAFCQKHILWTF